MQNPLFAQCSIDVYNDRSRRFIVHTQQTYVMIFGVIQVLRYVMQGVGWEGIKFPKKKRYGGVQFNVISATRWWVGGGQISRKKAIVTLEWHLTGLVPVSRFARVSGLRV